MKYLKDSEHRSHVQCESQSNIRWTVLVGRQHRIARPVHATSLRKREQNQQNARTWPSTAKLRSGRRFRGLESKPTITIAARSAVIYTSVYI